MKFVCQTLFDITRTDVTGHCKASRMPFQDRAGQIIKDETAWNRSRNQQRNWETVIQCMGLRTQPQNIQDPISTTTDLENLEFGDMYTGEQKVWIWTWSTEGLDVYDLTNKPLGAIQQDFEQVPVITGLTETARFMLPIFYPYGSIKNIYFKQINTNSD